MPDNKSLENSQQQLDELIEHKCRQLGKSGASKGSALHLAQWMKGQLGGSSLTGPLTPDDEPEPEVWSPETLRRRSEQLQIIGVIPGRNESRCEELEMSDTERSQSRSTERSRSQTSSDSQVTVRSGGPEKTVAVCRQCHKTCLANSNVTHQQQQVTSDNNNDLGLEDDEDDYEDNWGPLILMGMTALNATMGLTRTTADPFSPTDVPLISVLPPTPDTTPKISNFQWDDTDLSSPMRGSTPSPDTPSPRQNNSISESYQKKSNDDDDDDEDDDDDDDDDDEESTEQEPPYRSLSSPTGMKRYGTLASLEILDDKEPDGTDSDANGDWDSEGEEDCNKNKPPKDPNEEESPGSPQLEVVTQSLKGWTARAGSFVAEKMALFERLGEESRAGSFLDRYLRPTVDPQQQQSSQGDSPPEPTTTTSSGGAEDECSTSAATSGEEVWGTPTSGGELDEELAFPTGEIAAASHESPADSPSSLEVGDDDTELMMDELLATPPLSSSARGFPPRRRLEPLPEEEDTDSPTSSPAPPIIEKETPSPEQGKESGDVADNYRRAPPPPLSLSLITPDSTQQQSPGFFNRLRMRRGREEQQRAKSSRFLGFLSGRRNADDTAGGRPLFRIFNRESVDDIPTTLPRQLIPQHENSKQLERRFWKQLKRRRSGANPVIPSSAQVAA